jgi:hypothetical protein
MGQSNNTANTLKKFLGQDLTYSVREFVSCRPRIYFNILPFLQDDLSCRVDRNTKMVISGIWGCANTYAATAFEYGQPGVAVSHHLHVPAQVIQAARFNVPCLVLVRHPADAIASLASRGGVDYSVEGFRWPLKDYAKFYESVLKYKQHYVVADFKEVVTNFPAAIQRVNDRFGTNFHVPENGSDEAKKIVASKVQGVPRPYTIQDVKEFLQLPELAGLRIRAERAYQKFCTANDVPMR